MKNLFVLAFALALLVVGCQVPESALEPLRFVVIPTADVALTEEQFAPLVNHLSKELKREVKFMTVVDFAAVVEAMKYNHADIARLGPFSYVLATQEADVEVIVSDIRASSGTTSYRSVIIARTDRNITDLNGKSFAFLDVESTSGYMIPVTYMKNQGVELGEVFYAGTHNAVMLAVKNGTVDAGAVSDSWYATGLKEVFDEGESIILWTSDPIPSPPIVVQSLMDTALKNKIRNAFLSAPLEVIEPQGAKILGYAATEDSAYDVIREVQEALGLD